MSEPSDEFGIDPWAWLREIDEAESPDLSGFHVVAAVLATGEDGSRTEAAVQAQTVPVSAIVRALPADAAGDWIWVVPDDCEPEPDALSALLLRVLEQHDAAVIGSLLIEPRRRGAGKLVSDWSQTISSNGRMRTLTDPGELYQGQLSAGPALGVPASGMLVRGDVWRFLGGFNTELPRSHWGLDFGWRANLTGYLVLGEPAAQVTNYASYGDPADDRAAGLALIVANAPTRLRWLVTLRVFLVTLLAALGFLLGKDLERSGEEMRGLWRWLRNRPLRRSLADGLAALPIKPNSAAITKALQPTPGSAIRRAAGITAARFGGWLETFSGRGSSISIDEMIGDDFADVGGGETKMPLAAAVSVALLVGAVLAGRTTWGSGSLTTAQLLPAPDQWTGLLDSYLAPVPGGDGVGAPWAALTGLFSLIALGNPDWWVTAMIVLAVPLSWLVAFRLLRQLIADQYLAAIAALGYALTPVLIGSLNAGSLGVASTAVLLPMLGYSARGWLASQEWSWRSAGALAFWSLLLVSLVPAFWVVLAVAAVVSGLRAGRARAWLQWAAVLAAPLLLLVGPWGMAMIRYPGRLLTGIDPSLAPGTAVTAWQVLAGQLLPDAAPLWLTIVFFTTCWIAAFAAALRRPRVALPLLAVAVVMVAVMVAITHVAVQVPPGIWTRPQAAEWQLLVVAALLIAAVVGLQDVGEELAGVGLGLRHLGTLLLAIITAGSLLLGTGWWVISGQTGLSREPVGTVPAFVRNVQVSATPGRTLAMESDGDNVRWALVEGDFSRLGDPERGLAYGGSEAAKALAASVVARLISDTADEQIVADLQRLGVSYITLAGGEASQRISINNTPGLGLGTGTAEQFVWPVPGSGVATVVDGDQRTVTGAGQPIPAGAADRRLELAQPADPRWQVAVGDTAAPVRPTDPPGTAYTLGPQGGTLRLTLESDDYWWAWVQLAGIVLLALLAAPSVRRRLPAEPRRVAGGES
ncbi:MAG TPA: hypothetical protein PKD84_02730 [Propionicimonas sp.]|nr:hypothetical protein [Propionicimonas sp.]